MIAMESSYQDPIDETHNIDNHMMQDFDETEDTLSFCDLPIYRDAVDSQEFSTEFQSSTSSTSSSSSPDQENYFEFFSQEWNNPTTTENIIFCGKLIPYKDLIEGNNQEKPRNRGIFRWNSNSFNKSKTSKSNDSKSATSRCVNNNISKNGLSVERVSILTSPAKSRWHLYLFGLARFPTKMDLSDMKSRQIRRGPSTLFRLDSRDEKLGVGPAGRSTVKGLWGLIRDLGCGGGHHANAVVKASIGCIPRV